MQSPKFDDVDLMCAVNGLSAAALNELDFGVIGFDETEIITQYNEPEARWAGLERSKVIGSRLFEAVAPCMNNYLVAEPLRDALKTCVAVDVTLEYVLTFRMRPTPVTLRLLTDPQSKTRFILVRRKQ